MNSQREDQLDEIVVAYLKALDAGQPPDSKEILEQHPELRTELEAFFEDQERANQFSLPAFDLGKEAAVGTHPGTEPAPDGPLPSTTAYQPESRERYTIIRFHAGGGIGDVYLAQDGDLGRQVALKELKPKFADIPMFRARFLEEARITGQLEHPGIVPVHEVTRRAGDQKPFYTMRFIKGRTLAHAIKAYHRKRKAGETGPLDLRELLNVFVGVCNAVAYAHSRGVIHRDLKPQNVALGDYGEALVLDWGLAKALGEKTGEDSQPPVTVEPEADRGESMSGQRIGTIPYMAPEQAEGRIDLMDRRTDVYGLGAILYEILTGEPPFTGPEGSVVLDRVKHEVLTSPRQRVPVTPVALEAVCLKALAKKREDRYESAKEVAQEIEHWLADEPVGAWREPWTPRLGRWARRHNALVAGLAALLLTAVVALTVGTLLLGNANARTQEQRDLARKNFHKARKAVDYLTSVSESTLLNSPLPGLQPLRNELLVAALKYYQDFIDQGPDDPALRSDLAAAFFRVGDIAEAIGGKKDSLNAFIQARDHYAALALADPENRSFQNELAKSYRRVADLQGEIDQAEDALASYKAAIDIGEKLRSIDPGNNEFLSELAKSYGQLGRRQHLITQPKEALGSYAKALTILVNLDPNNVQFQSSLADCYNNMSFLHQEIGSLGEALQSSKKALAITEKLALALPENTEFQARLARAYFEYGLVERYMDQTARALEFLRTSVSKWKKLANENPAVTRFQFEFGKASWTLGNSQCDLNQLDEALKSGEQAQDLLKKLAAKDPTDEQVQEHLASSYLIIGKVQRKTGNAAEALKSFEQGAALLEQLGDRSTLLVYNNLACAWALCSSVVGEGKGQLTEAEKAKKLKYADQAIDALNRWVAGGAGNAGMLKTDEDLKILETRKDFQELVNMLEQKAKTQAK